MTLTFMTKFVKHRADHQQICCFECSILMSTSCLLKLTVTIDFVSCSAGHIAQYRLVVTSGD